MKSNRSNNAVARRTCALAAACMALALGACTTLGTGAGIETPGNAPVSFSWKSKDGGVSGTMSATLPEAETYTGQYLEITSTVQNEALWPISSGWSPGWWDWEPIATTNYSGNVVANLAARDEHRMRCHFRLKDPLRGMAGGGQGTCQLTSGAIVNAIFPGRST